MDMLFANEIVSVDESRYGVNAKLERWRKTFESKVLNKFYKDRIYGLQLQWAHTKS